MWYTHKYSNIKVYQKYLYASSGKKAEGISTKIRRDGDQDPVASEEV